MVWRNGINNHGRGEPLWLPDDHPAIREGRTLFPSTRAIPSREAPVLMPGGHGGKLGSVVTKGRWRGMPIFSLTLEERKTCPRSCLNWNICYGNHVFSGKRWKYGLPLYGALDRNLIVLDRFQHPGGFVVRLHMLGDSKDEFYAQYWVSALKRFPALRVFGHTAWGPHTLVGEILYRASRYHWDRFSMRFSDSGLRRRGVTTIMKGEPVPKGAIVCPAQTHEWSDVRVLRALLAHAEDHRLPRALTPNAALGAMWEENTG